MNKTLEQCESHGADHAAYGWSARGLGFPATPEQQAAYNRGYVEQTERMALGGDSYATANLKYVKEKLKY